MTATRIDPNELTPSNPDGAATAIPSFFDKVISAVNEHADELDGGAVVAYLTPEQFGAVGDGVTNDLAAFKTMIAAASGQPNVRILTIDGVEIHRCVIS